jgi:hypothetical protein
LLLPFPSRNICPKSMPLARVLMACAILLALVDAVRALPIQRE